MHETQSNRDRERDRKMENQREGEKNKKTSNKFISLPYVVGTSIIAMALSKC